MSAQDRIRKLVATKLAGRKINVVGFVDVLLGLASELGEIHCSPSADSALQFNVSDAAPFRVEVDGAKGKLRMLCARIAQLCTEPNDGTLSPYGGEGSILAQAGNGKALWHVRFRNTASAVEFAIAPVTIGRPTAA